MKKLYLFPLLFIVGCTDAEIAGIKSIDAKHHVICYSGGKIIYEGVSTGKVLNEDHSDGYYFEDEKTHKMVSVRDNCVIAIE